MPTIASKNHAQTVLIIMPEIAKLGHKNAIVLIFKGFATPVPDS